MFIELLLWKILSVETFDLDNGHPNEKGYNAIAEDVYSYIIDRNLLCGANH